LSGGVDLGEVADVGREVDLTMYIGRDPSALDFLRHRALGAADRRRISLAIQRRPQRMEATLERRQLALGVAEHQGHVALDVAHLGHPAGTLARPAAPAASLQWWPAMTS